MRLFGAALVLAVLPVAAAEAQTADPAPPVLAGLQALVRAGADSAVGVWTATWPAEDSASVRQLRDGFAEIGASQGIVSGFDILTTHALGRRVRRTYAVLWYTQRPLFAMFHAYEVPDGGWRILDIRSHTNIEQVFPEPLLAP